MEKLFILITLIIGCTSKGEAEASATRWANALNIKIIGLSCSSGPLARCSVNIRHIDGSEAIVPLNCDDEDCIIDMQRDN